jgi:hypothetical protein
MNDINEEDDAPENIGVDTPEAQEPSLGEGPQVAVLGTLPRRAEQKTSKEGKRTRYYVTASINIISSGKWPRFWSLIANDEDVREALLAIPPRTLVCVHGALVKNDWEREDGTTAHDVRVNVRSIERLQITRVNDRRESSEDRLTGDDGGDRPFAPTDSDSPPF